MSFVSSKPDPYPTPVDVVVYLISAIMNRVIKRFYCTTTTTTTGSGGSSSSSSSTKSSITTSSSK